MLFTSLHSETIFILLIRVFFTISNFSGFFERFWSYTKKKRWEKTLWKISIEFSARVKQWSEHWKHLFGLKQPTEKNFEQFLKENRKKCEICGVFKKKNILWRREKTNIIKVWTIKKWHHSNTKKNTEQKHLNYKKWHFTPIDSTTSALDAYYGINWLICNWEISSKKNQSFAIYFSGLK